MGDELLLHLPLRFDELTRATGRDAGGNLGRSERTVPQGHVLLTGGGTGGHVFPALAVAAELLRRGFRVSFTGQATGLEARLAGERGIPFYPLPARPFVGRSRLGQVLALLVLAPSSLKAWRLIRNLEVDVVLATGGYVSAPAILGAYLARRPTLLLEPNVQAGTANRWLSRLASAAAVAYEGTGSELRCPTWLTGVPVRPEFFAVASELPALGSPCVLILGGSQGARELNHALPQVVGQLAASLPSLRVLHQTGERDFEATREAYAGALTGRLEGKPAAARDLPKLEVEVVPFVGEVAAAMAAAHLVICRAGAVTLAEVCAAGRPSILVPLRLAGAHQLQNAVALEEAGAAILVPGASLGDGSLVGTLHQLLTQPERLQHMALAARGLARAEASQAIVAHLERMVRRP